MAMSGRNAGRLSTAAMASKLVQERGLAECAQCVDSVEVDPRWDLSPGKWLRLQSPGHVFELPVASSLLQVASLPLGQWPARLIGV